MMVESSGVDLKSGPDYTLSALVSGEVFWSVGGTLSAAVDLDFSKLSFILAIVESTPRAADKSVRSTRKAMTAADFRRIALSMPEAVEGSHFGNADFRVGNKIFATLALQKTGFGVLLLTPEEQAGMVEDEPSIFSPVPGGWGRKGSTRVRLAKVAPDILRAGLQMAWRRKAPKRLLHM
jgi:hypothetical protein